MKKRRGFTLIELLAVIIILAIIALIATPIIMRVIENSKKGAAERGAENYARAVETQVAALRTDGTILDGTYGIKANGNLCLDKSTTCNESGEIKIEMTGTKPSGGSIVITDGKVTATGTSLTIGEYTATINANGSATAVKSDDSQQETGPNYYYSLRSGNVGGTLPNDASESAPSGRRFYLGLTTADGTKSSAITAAYVCFKNETEYCIQGGVAEELRAEVLTSNQGILDTAFPGVCSGTRFSYSCDVEGLSVAVNLTNGYVEAYSDGPGCYVNGDGTFGC